MAIESPITITRKTPGAFSNARSGPRKPALFVS